MIPVSVGQTRGWKQVKVSDLLGTHKIRVMFKVCL